MPALLAPDVIALIVQGIQAAIKAAPAIEAVAVSARDWIASLFKAGLISAATQDRIFTHVNFVCDAALAGTEDPAWLVEPDPV